MAVASGLVVSQAMEDMCSMTLGDCQSSHGIITGYLDGDTARKEFLDSLKKLGYKFAIRTSKNFGKDVDEANTCRQHCSSDHDYIGSPSPCIKFEKTSGSLFYHGTTTYMHCVFGPQDNHKKKILSNDQDDTEGKKLRLRNKTSKKLGCPALLRIKERHMFTEDKYRFPNDSTYYMRKKILGELQSLISKGRYPPSKSRYGIVLSTVHSHPVRQQVASCESQSIMEDNTSDPARCSSCDIREALSQDEEPLPITAEKEEDRLQHPEQNQHKNLQQRPQQQQLFQLNRQVELPLQQKQHQLQELHQQQHELQQQLQEQQQRKEQEKQQQKEAKDSEAVRETEIKKMQKNLRDIYNEITDLTDNCSDLNVLKSTSEMMKSVRNSLKQKLT